MGWPSWFSRKPAAEPGKPKKKICCACPETKRARDECTTLHGPEAPQCQKLIEAHKECLRSEGFKLASGALGAAGGAMNRSQRERLTQFSAITGADSSLGTRCLEAAGWSVENAIEIYYSNGMQMGGRNAGSRVDRKAIEQLYARYKEPDDDGVGVEGISQLCDDLGVAPDDVALLVLSWHFGAEAMCEYSRKEFEEGMARLGCDSLDKLRAKLPALRAELRDPAKFRQIYQFAYLFSREKGQKIVQLDVALAMWDLLLPFTGWPHAEAWKEFLRTHHKRAISRDTWNQTLPFLETTAQDFSNYDDSGAWPYLLDEFVAEMRKQQQQQAADGTQGDS